MISKYLLDELKSIWLEESDMLVNFDIDFVFKVSVKTFATFIKISSMKTVRYEKVIFMLVNDEEF